MLETLLPLDLPPGFVNNGTVYASKGRWYVGSLVRFRGKVLQPIGGWVARSIHMGAIAGTPRAAIAWRPDALPPFASGGTEQDAVAVGTTQGLFFMHNEALVGNTWDVETITPSGFSSATYWQLETFGKYLIAVKNGSTVYFWDSSTSQAVAANTASAFGTAGPSVAVATVATPERFLFLLGAGAGVGSGVAARSVMWPSQETVTDWVPSASNTAGQQELATRGSLIAGRRGRGETLLWTTADLWRATYVGGTLIYGFAQAGDHCGLLSTQAAVVIDGVAYWMSDRKFCRYDGVVRTIPCQVEDYVFSNMNTANAYQIWALPNVLFGEVTWFYPSANASEVDSYVTYDYQQDHWTFGSLARSAGVPRQFGFAATGPVMFDPSGTAYDHETGSARSATAYAESGPVEIGNGDHVMRVQRIVPDDKTLGDVSASLYAAMAPDATETLNGPYTLTSQTSVRLTARQVRLRITEVAANAWRVGTVRLGAISGGRR